MCKVVPIFVFLVLRMSSCFCGTRGIQNRMGLRADLFTFLKIKLLGMLFVSFPEEVYRPGQPCVALWLCEDKADSLTAVHADRTL